MLWLFGFGRCARQTRGLHTIHWFMVSAGTVSRPQLLGYVALCCIWGSTWLAIRVAVQYIPPLEAAAVRFLAAGLLLLGMAAAQRRRWPHGQQQWNTLVVLSLTFLAIPYGLVFWAEQYVSSGMTAVLFSAFPLVVALLTPLMTGKKVPRQAVFAMLVACGGLAYLFYDGLGNDRKALLGGIAVVAAVLISSWSLVYAKDRLQHVDAVVSSTFQLLFGSVALLWATWALESHKHAVWNQSAVLAVAFLVLFGSCAAFVIYYWLLKHMQPYQLSTLNLVFPIIAVIEGAVLQHEHVGVLMVIAMTLVLGAVFVALRAQAVETRNDGRVLVVEENR
ncbi:MAG TPA: EamA family transporter [Candidatus Angelobacter sp.]|jgi:drug/metabolite transporter (DMT)-like permease|nr:EamA family transporter [Candidatus Angelobacter sp.]